MRARSLLLQIACVASIASVALPDAVPPLSSPAHAASLPACSLTSGCLAEVVNPNWGRTLGGRVTITNETRLPVIAVLRPDGGLAYLPTAVGQDVLATLTVEPVSLTDTLASVQSTGSLVASDAAQMTVRLDGIPAYAVVPRLRLGFTARFVGRPVVVGEGSFERAPINTRVVVAVGGAITLVPSADALAAPLPGFVLQLKVLGRWITLANGRIPSSAVARFAPVPSKTWTCHGPGGGCN